MAHGVPKLLALVSGNLGFVDQMSAMFGSSLMGWAITLITVVGEAICGLFLVIGVRVRLSGLYIAALFIGIAVIMHGSDFPAMFGVGSGNQGKFEFPFLIGIGGLALAFLGSGRYSVMQD